MRKQIAGYIIAERRKVPALVKLHDLCILPISTLKLDLTTFQPIAFADLVPQTVTPIQCELNCYIYERILNHVPRH